jgi:hypothetical protein
VETESRRILRRPEVRFPKGVVTERLLLQYQEMWHEGLEEASRLYFGEKNVPAAVATLEALHKIAGNRRDETRPGQEG